MREELESRPSAILFLGLVLGLIALAFPLACFLAFGSALWIRKMPRRWLLAGAFVVGLVLSPSPGLRLEYGTPVRGVGVVASVPMLSADSQTYELNVSGLTLLATMPLEPRLMLGDRVRVYGIAKPVQAVHGRNAAFDRAQGRIQLDDAEVVVSGSVVAHAADDWRRSFLSFLDRSLAPRDASLVDALCFNGRRLLDSETRENMASSGLIHMISASGLQVFVLAGLLSALLRFFPVQRSIQILLLSCLLLLYAIGAGLQPQIVRACLMSLLGLSAYLFRRDPDAISALAISGVAYLLWRPESIYGMAFQLSFVTVGSVALFYQPTRRRESGSLVELIRDAKDFLRLSAIVTLASIPLVAYYLGVVSLVSVFANLAVCWSLPLIVGTAFASHGVFLLLPELGERMSTAVLGPFCRWNYDVLGWMGGGWGAIQVPDFNAAWLLVYYGAWMLTYRRRVVQP